jgi:hypothetical protein
VRTWKNFGSFNFHQSVNRGTRSLARRSPSRLVRRQSAPERISFVFYRPKYCSQLQANQHRRIIGGHHQRFFALEGINHYISLRSTSRTISGNYSGHTTASMPPLFPKSDSHTWTFYSSLEKCNKRLDRKRSRPTEGQLTQDHPPF